jgi:hypothetical protein
LDFILRRAFGILQGEILEIPTYGIWSFHGDDERKYRGGPPCFWEIYEGDPVTGAILQRLTEELDAGIVLRRGFFPTVPSHKANMNQVKYGSAKWPEQVATDLLNGEGDYVDSEPSTTDAPIYKKPSPCQLFRYHLKRLRAKAGIVTRGVPDWNIGVIRRPIHDVADDIESIEWYPRPCEDRFRADPFHCRIDGQAYVFFEDYSYETGRGKISVVDYDNGFVPPQRTALEEPFHLSYPYVFKTEGKVYATPETQAADEIRLYRVHAPDEWEHVTTIASDIKGADPTVFKYDDRWWLWYTRDSEYTSTLTDLEVRYAPKLAGPWRPHANNPVKTDIRSARPGGTPFVHGGDLYRPAQYCAEGYGKRVVINRVNKLTTTAYSEEPVREVGSSSNSKYRDGRHTLSGNSDIAFIDGKRLVWNHYARKQTWEQLQNAVGLE